MTEIEPVAEAQEGVDILDLLIVPAKHKKAILRNTIAAAAAAVVYALTLPNIFTATVTLMPPEKSPSASALFGQLGAAGAVVRSPFLIKSQSELYIGMLKSRSVADDVAKRLGLKSYYQAESDEAARKALAVRMKASASDDGFIKLEYSDRDPKRAAEIANGYVDALNRVTSTLAVTEASQRRLFFEKQLASMEEKLSRAENDLRQESGIINVYPEEKEIAEENAKLRAEIASREIKLSSMQVGMTTRNPEYLRIEGELAGLKKELAGSNSGQAPSAEAAGKSGAYLRKFREVKYDQAVMDLLFKQFEAAKIDEAKDSPVIQVLDPAIPPDVKSAPKRSLIVIMATLAAFFLSIFWAFLREAMARAGADPARAEKFAALKKHVSFRR